MKYEISGLAVELQGGREYMKSCMAKYTLPLENERERICDLGIFIERGTNIPKPAGKILSNHLVWCLSEQDGIRTAWRTLPGFDDIVSARMDFLKNRTDISIFSMDDGEEAADGDNPDAVDSRDFLFAGQAFSDMCLRHSRMVLHSSCIAVDGKAILFSAPSGTGKSTHTGLWQKHVPNTVMINDDTPVLRLDRPDHVLACGSPWSGKTRLNENLSVPLHAIVFLERGEKNTIAPLPTAQAFGRLLGECRKFPFADSMSLAAEHCAALIERVPIYRLTCNISYDAVKTVREELSL